MSLTCLEKTSLIVLGAIGLRILLRISKLVWKKLIGPSLGFGLDLRTQGRWAVITGSTGGIGKAFAECFAKKGLDLVLISRSLEKLEKDAADIREKYGVEVRVLDIDLTEGQVAFSKIAKATEDLEIAVVVNNAGASYDFPDLFTNVSEECLARILQLNVAAVTGVSRVLLPQMYKRKKGVLLNISSALATIPSPYLTVYAASKAYIVKLSYDLVAEAEPNGVTVQCIIPGPVATAMSKIKKATWMAPRADKFVEHTVKSIGLEVCTTGYLPHFMLTSIVHALKCICEKGTVWLICKTMSNIRGRAVRSQMRKLKEDASKDEAPRIME